MKSPQEDSERFQLYSKGDISHAFQGRTPEICVDGESRPIFRSSPLVSLEHPCQLNDLLRPQVARTADEVLRSFGTSYPEM